MTKTLMKAHTNWLNRAPDERFTNLYDLRDSMQAMRKNSRQLTVPSKAVKFIAKEGNDDLLIAGPSGNEVNLTHFGFGKLANMAKAPADFVRDLNPATAALVMNERMQQREVDDIGLLLTKKDDDVYLRAATGPKYGRIWNYQLAEELVNRFGDGITGDWKVPGEFGKDVVVTTDNTTLFAGEKDMFVFLADEKNRIEMPNRRAGKSGSFARGFFVWNSEVGDSTIGGAWFLFDYVCCNRIVWGVGEYSEKRIRHTVTAPERWIDAVTPVIAKLADYSNASEKMFLEPIRMAQEAKVEEPLDFLKKRFASNTRVSAKMIDGIATAFTQAEERPMETLWDLTTGVTEYAKSVINQDVRVALETEAGKIMALAA